MPKAAQCSAHNGTVQPRDRPCDHHQHDRWRGITANDEHVGQDGKYHRRGKQQAAESGCGGYLRYKIVT
ncbi:hypothetical protein PSAC2689_70203 [Paraburkholderia sacchari]